MQKVILIELNEVPLRVIDRYVAQRPDSALSRLAHKSNRFKTVCEDEIQLDPWISWPTLHRGVTDKQHGIYHLGQIMTEVDEHFPPVWTMLAKSGRSVGVFGSLHSNNIPADLSNHPFYVPDFFANEVFAKPASLEPFQRLNIGMTRESARNVSRKVPIDLVGKAASSVPELGLRLDTLLEGGKQLLSEVGNKSRKIRRRNYQSLLMADAFVKQMEKTKPDFATVYTNSVAASMHRYWAALFPEDYNSQVSPEWVETYRDEIMAALDMFDRCLARIMGFVERNPEYGIAVATSMGQGAIPFEPVKNFLTIADLGRFMDILGLDRSDWVFRPAMVPCVGVLVNADAIDRLRTALATVKIGGQLILNDARPIMPMSWSERDQGFFSFYIQFDDYEGPDEVRVGNHVYSFAEAGLNLMLHEDGINCTAQHQREGSLLVYNGARPSDRESEISTLDILPSLLAHYGLEKPAYMRGSALVSL